MKTPKKKTPAAPPATTPSAAQAARARESLRRLLVAYAPAVPFFASLLAAHPTPKLPRPGRRRARRGGDPGAAGGWAGDGTV